jgi:hypothetical protein
MKNQKALLLLLCVFVLYVAISCESAPQAVEQESLVETPTESNVGTATVDPNQQAPGQDALDKLNAAMARAESAREQALGVQGPVYFPDEWGRAESSNEAGKLTKTDTLGGVNQAIALFNAAADGYDSIGLQSAPLFAQDMEDARNALDAAMAHAEQSKKNAQDNKGPTYFPDDWKSAEASHKDALGAPSETLDEMKNAAAMFAAAADEYDAIAGKSLPLLAKEKDDAQKALNDAIAKANKSRQDAMAVNGQTFFPNDWKNAEARNQSAQGAKKDSTDEIKAATALFIAAADAYDTIAKNAAARSAKEKDDAQKALNAAIARAEQSRKQATDAKGQTNFPTEWKNAEAKNQTAKNAKRSTTDEMKAAVPLYNAAADAYDDIVKKEAARVAAAAAAAAEAARAAAAAEAEAARAAAAAEAARIAAEAQKAMDDAKARAEKERQAAIDIKAQAAVPNDFNNAESIFQQAMTDFNRKAATATERFNQSTPLFTAAIQATEKKRNSAEDAVSTAKERTAESIALAIHIGHFLEENNEID